MKIVDFLSTLSDFTHLDLAFESPHNASKKATFLKANPRESGSSVSKRL